MSTRREFLKQAALGAAALSTGEIGLSAAAKSRPEAVSPSPVVAAKAKGSNDAIRVGISGVNGRGHSIAREVSKMKDSDIVCICDCDSAPLERCRATVENIRGKKPDAERDYRKMLDRKDIDGVIIAMPDHWHAPAAIMGMQAGKHVYVEKPTSHNPHENELLLKAEAKYKKCVVTVGNQRRSWPNVVKGVMEVKNGAIGEVHYAEAWYTADRKSIGVGKVAPVPETLDWDLWQGPAPRVSEFHDNYLHYNWHWFRNWGTGEALNNGTHYVDILRWGMGVEFPTKVSSTGGRYHYMDDDWEFFDTQIINFEFGNKGTFVWKGYSCGKVYQDAGTVGMKFCGEDKFLEISGGNSYRIYDITGKVIKSVSGDENIDINSTTSPAEQLDNFHFENWFEAIRKGTPLNSTLRDACISTQLVQLGNISQFTGRSLTIDPYSGRIVGDKDAMKLWSREYEPGWEPKI